MDTPETKRSGTAPESVASLFQTDKPPVSGQDLDDAVQQQSVLGKPKRKKYYSPNEVMKKKGCVGCGGVALAMLLLSGLALVTALI